MFGDFMQAIWGSFVALVLVVTDAAAPMSMTSSFARKRHDKIKLKLPKGEIKGLGKFPWGAYPLWRVHRYIFLKFAHVLLTLRMNRENKN